MSKSTEKSTRPASADYPVDPAERSNQEARLRKAAAAGASAAKLPIPGLKLQPTPSLPAAPEPQTISSKLAAITESVPEVFHERTDLQIINNEVLVEIRKISAWADLQRRISKWSLIVLVGLVLIVVGSLMVMDRNQRTELDTAPSLHQLDWYDVDRNVRLGDFEKAIALGEELIVKTPQYSEAHQRLAKAYLAAGNLDKAKEHYAEAFRLFPSEENEKLVSAIEKRINTEKP